MALEIRPYRESDLEGMRAIWNAIVEAGNAFPQVYPLSAEEAAEFFAQQSLSAVAVIDDVVFGLYILHPNNVGRCGHVANASYGVAERSRGLGLGRELVKDSLVQAARLGFRGIQFNAVVASNVGAMHLYEDLGFTRVGTIPGGYLNGYGAFEDMHIYYRDCKEWADGCGCGCGGTQAGAVDSGDNEEAAAAANGDGVEAAAATGGDGAVGGDSVEASPAAGGDGAQAGAVPDGDGADGGALKSPVATSADSAEAAAAANGDSAEVPVATSGNRAKSAAAVGGDGADEGAFKPPIAAERVEGPAPSKVAAVAPSKVAAAMPTELDLESEQEILGEVPCEAKTAVVLDEASADEAQLEAQPKKAKGEKKLQKAGKKTKRGKGKKAEKGKGGKNEEKSKAKKSKKGRKREAGKQAK